MGSICRQNGVVTPEPGWLGLEQHQKHFFSLFEFISSVYF